MIISDRYRFVFVHIPKCAGSYVRNRLEPYDDTGGRFSGRDRPRPFLGIWHYAHIPLHVLQQHLPSEFDCLNAYLSYAVYRDPFDRFPSSLAQRLKQFKGAPLHTLGRTAIRHEIDATITYLSRHGDITDPSYIHFVRQSDYLELHGKRIIQNIYSLENVSNMLSDIGELVGINLGAGLQDGRINQTDVYRYDGLRRALEPMRPTLNRTILKLFPESIKKQIRGLLYVPRKQHTPDIFQSDIVKSFVGEYYSRDIQLGDLAKNRISSTLDKSND